MNSVKDKVWYQRLLSFVLNDVKQALSGSSGRDKAVPDFVIAAMKAGLGLVEANKDQYAEIDPELIGWASKIVSGENPSYKKIIDAASWYSLHNTEESKSLLEDGSSVEAVQWLLQGDFGDGRGSDWWLAKQQDLYKNKSFYVFKDKNQKYRWFGWVTNKWRDRDEDILTDAAHVEFCQFLDAHPHLAPQRWTWHTPGTARKHQVDWWDYANGFFVYSGPLEESEVEADLKDLGIEIGMSHGFFVLEREGRYIRRYRTFEVSDLPLDKASNPYTELRIEEENKKMFSTHKRQYLIDRFGEETVVDLEKDTEAREAALKELGVDWKSVNDEYEAEIENRLAQRVAEASKSTVQQIVDQVVTAFNMPALQKALSEMNEKIEEAATLANRVAELEESLKHLLETEDERIAKAITPVEPISWDLRPTVKEAVEVEALPADVQEEVSKAIGEFDWLANLNPLGGK